MHEPQDHVRTGLRHSVCEIQICGEVRDKPVVESQRHRNRCKDPVHVGCVLEFNDGGGGGRENHVRKAGTVRTCGEVKQIDKS